jgi:hypothetical protein
MKHEAFPQRTLVRCSQLAIMGREVVAAITAGKLDFGP